MAVNRGFQRRLPRFPTSQYRSQDYQPSREDQISALFSQAGVDPSRHLNGTYEDPQSRINRLAASDRPMEDISRSVGGIAWNTPVNDRMAQIRAGLEFDPQSRRLERSLDDLYRQRDRDVEVNRLYGQYAQEGMGEVFDRLKESLIQNNQAVSTGYGNAGAAIGQGYQQAAGAQQAGAQAVLGGLGEQAQSLGLQGAEADPSGRIQNLNQELQSFINSQGANSQAGVGFLQGALNGIGMGSVGNAGLEQAQQTGRLHNEVLGNLSDIMLGAQDQAGDITSQLGDILNQRGMRVTDLMGQFEERDFERNYRQQESDYERMRNENLDRLASEIQRGTLDLQRGELDFNRQRWGQENDLANRRFGLDERLGMGQLGVQQQELTIRAQQIQAEMARMQPGSIDYMMAQAELENLQAQTAALRNETPQYQGGSGVEQYMATNNITPTSRRIFNQIADRVRQRVSTAASQGTQLDPVAEFMNEYATYQPSNSPGFGTGNIAAQQAMQSWQRMEPHFRTLAQILFGQY